MPTETEYQTSDETTVALPADSNQALGLGQFAIDFMAGRIGQPGDAALRQTERFFVDAALCGVSALALGTNAPTVLRNEALEYPTAGDEPGATVFGSAQPVHPEKAVAANSSAVREWDANGTNFGYNPRLGHTAGEFGHNDYYAVTVAAAQIAGLDGAATLRGMLLLDEIRGRLAEVFSLKSYKIDHVVHGAIASAATFGAMLGATPKQIESAIGMVVAHYIPYRAIRAGKQLSDSKGASAAISAEVAVLSMLRSMRGFVGPKDIFRNPEAIFRLNEPTGPMDQHAPSPFDLVLTHSGDDFAVMGMHFKLGIYEHQSAGAIQAVIDLLHQNPNLLDDPQGGKIERIDILAYDPAIRIIGDPAKKDPRTRQSADHSMAYIVATLLRKALQGASPDWKSLTLQPHDYSKDAIFDPLTRRLMERIEFAHGGKEYDEKYPDGIPTSLKITADDGKTHDSGLVMYPAGHARNTEADLDDLLEHKWRVFAAFATDEPKPLIERFTDLPSKSAGQIRSMNEFELQVRGSFE